MATDEMVEAARAVLASYGLGVGKAGMLLIVEAALEAALAVAPRVEGDAVDAAIDEWFNGNPWVDGSDKVWVAQKREEMSRAIAAADRARGRSYVEWDDIATQGILRRLVDQTWMHATESGHAPSTKTADALIALVTSEMPAPPAWATQAAKHETVPPVASTQAETIPPPPDTVPFTQEDYESLSGALKACCDQKDEITLKAAMSNNLNIILAALDYSASALSPAPGRPDFDLRTTDPNGGLPPDTVPFTGEMREMLRYLITNWVDGPEWLALCKVAFPEDAV